MLLRCISVKCPEVNSTVPFLYWNQINACDITKERYRKHGHNFCIMFIIGHFISRIFCIHAVVHFNTHRPEQNTWYFVDDIFKYILLNIFHFVSNFTDVCSSWGNRQKVSIGSRHGIAACRQQGINHFCVHHRAFLGYINVDMRNPLYTGMGKRSYRLRKRSVCVYMCANKCIPIFVIKSWHIVTCFGVYI